MYACFTMGHGPSSAPHGLCRFKPRQRRLRLGSLRAPFLELSTSASAAVFLRRRYAVWYNARKPIPHRVRGLVLSHSYSRSYAAVHAVRSSQAPNARGPRTWEAGSETGTKVPHGQGSGTSARRSQLWIECYVFRRQHVPQRIPSVDVPKRNDACSLVSAGTYQPGMNVHHHACDRAGGTACGVRDQSNGPDGSQHTSAPTPSMCNVTYRLFVVRWTR